MTPSCIYTQFSVSLIPLGLGTGVRDLLRVLFGTDTIHFYDPRSLSAQEIIEGHNLFHVSQ
jgi:hypothetical protein